MPVYEYKCANCNQVHEVIQKFSDAPMAECPNCQGPVTKLMSMSSFSLKGTGWYSTDYKKTSVPPPATANAAKSETTTPATGSTNAAPAASPATPATAAPAAASPKDSGKNSS